MKGEVKLINGKRVATPEYRSWQMMRNRCLNPKAGDYWAYGARGICITPKWNLFEGFLADMGKRPTAKHTLDRIDVEEHYSQWNCRWATRQEQARNRRATFHTMNLELADQIRELYKSGQYFQYEIAALFGLSQVDISQVTRNVRWARE